MGDSSSFYLLNPWWVGEKYFLNNENVKYKNSSHMTFSTALITKHGSVT